MKEIEEKLWDYIDGSCSAEEQTTIRLLIDTDPAYKLKHDELLQLNSEFFAMELDEPPMAFNYRVMEAIRSEKAQQPLKAAINKRIVWGIGAFFLISILVIVVLAVDSVNWSSLNGSAYHLPGIEIPQLKNYFGAPVIKAFVFLDIVLSLFLLDNYLRRKISGKQA